MPATICPTITADTPVLYREQIKRVSEFASRIHIDLADGVLAPQKLVDVDTVWWPGGMRADLHVMYQQPFEHIEAFRALAPQLVIVHAEAEGDFVGFADYMHRHGIEAGVALLQDTDVTTITPALGVIDHVLIFSGQLGFFGGQVDLKLLEKVRLLKRLKPTLEIGWDGGVNATNARALKDGGVDVLNVGGFIHKNMHPAVVYEKLRQA